MHVQKLLNLAKEVGLKLPDPSRHKIAQGWQKAAA
jgi:hypothetical protein